MRLLKQTNGNEILLEHGYRYNCGKSNKNGSTLWRCSNRRECSATVTLDITRTTILRRKVHSCAKDTVKNKVLKALAKCKEEVCKDFGPIQPIYEKCFAKLKERG